MGELTFGEKLQKPVIKFGCLPALIIFIIFLISVFTGNNKKIDSNGETFKPSTIVKDFCTLSIDELKAKYGAPEVDNIAGDQVYNWILNKEDNIRVTIFYDKEKRDVVRFSGIELGTFFWDTLDWDKGNINTVPSEKADYVRNLNGINEAVYKHELKTLNIKLSDNITNFGKL